MIQANFYSLHICENQLSLGPLSWASASRDSYILGVGGVFSPRERGEKENVEM